MKSIQVFFYSEAPYATKNYVKPDFKSQYLTFIYLQS